jgi:site-specific recombinase XerD
MRAFIEQLAKEHKSPSTIENYCRDLNDFLSAFPDFPFPELLEADENLIAHYVDWLWSRDARRGSGHQADRGNITYLTGCGSHGYAHSTTRHHIAMRGRFVTSVTSSSWQAVG